MVSRHVAELKHVECYHDQLLRRASLIERVRAHVRSKCKDHRVELLFFLGDGASYDLTSEGRRRTVSMYCISGGHEVDEAATFASLRWPYKGAAACPPLSTTTTATSNQVFYPLKVPSKEDNDHVLIRRRLLRGGVDCAQFMSQIKVMSDASCTTALPTGATEDARARTRLE